MLGNCITEDELTMIRQLLYAVGVFIIIFAGLNVRMIINDSILNDREWCFIKHWKFVFILSFVVSLAVFIYLRVMGQTHL